MRGRRGPRLALPALLGLLLGGSSAWAAELDYGDLRIELGGSLRALYTHGRDLHLDPDAQQVEHTRRDDVWSGLLRARSELEVAWGERLSGEVVYDVELLAGTARHTLSQRFGEAIGTQTWLDADRSFSRHRDVEARHLLYRAWVRYEGERLDLTLGRQRIPLGRARLWNPTDLFNPISPLAIQSQQRIGQDAALLRARLREDLHAVAIWSPMDEPDEHRGALRLEYFRPELDASLMAGYFARDRVIGLDFARNVGGAAVRGEVTYSHLERRRRASDGRSRAWQVVLSADYEFPVGSGIYTLVEHFWNENTETRQIRLAKGFPLAALGAAPAPILDRITTVVPNQTAFQIGYDLTPLLRADLLTFYDWHGPSRAILPVLSYSLSDEAELRAGAQLFHGRRRERAPGPPTPGALNRLRSEYGDAASRVFLQLDWFF